MLNLDKQFRIYDTTPRKAAKSLMQAGFISSETLEPILGKLYLSKMLKNHKDAQNPVEWDEIIDGVFESGMLKYHAVSVHTAPVESGFPPAPSVFEHFPMRGFPPPVQAGFPIEKPSLDDKTLYYDVEGVDVPMTLEGIFTRYESNRGNFVAICRKVDGKLKLIGFVH